MWIEQINPMDISLVHFRVTAKLCCGLFQRCFEVVLVSPLIKGLARRWSESVSLCDMHATKLDWMDVRHERPLSAIAWSICRDGCSIKPKSRIDGSIRQTINVCGKLSHIACSGLLERFKSNRRSAVRQ